MLCYNPVPWLVQRDDRPALLARRRLDLFRQDDASAARAWCQEMIGEQCEDGSWCGSLLATAGAVKRLCELRVPQGQPAQRRGCAYLIDQLLHQPGGATRSMGRLTTPCDLGGFFGPYDQRGDPQRIAQGAVEMNHYRVFEPLRGPQQPVRHMARSSRDRPGPSSCYAWGLIPLCYTLEALALAGLALDPRLRPAWSALLASQRQSGGWCRNLGGHPNCSLHALGAISAHPSLYQGETAQRLVAFMTRSRGRETSWWRGTHLFAVLEVFARLDMLVAQALANAILVDLAPRQRRDGSFGGPHAVERVAVAIAAQRMPAERERMCYL